MYNQETTTNLGTRKSFSPALSSHWPHVLAGIHLASNRPRDVNSEHLRNNFDWCHQTIGTKEKENKETLKNETIQYHF